MNFTRRTKQAKPSLIILSQNHQVIKSSFSKLKTFKKANFWIEDYLKTNENWSLEPNESFQLKSTKIFMKKILGYPNQFTLNSNLQKELQDLAQTSMTREWRTWKTNFCSFQRYRILTLCLQNPNFRFLRRLKSGNLKRVKCRTLMSLSLKSKKFILKLSKQSLMKRR